MTNSISYRLDGRVAFPEVGLAEAGREDFRPVGLDRFASAIDGGRAPVMDGALSSAYRDGDCLIALNIEDPKALSSAPYMRRYLHQSLGVPAGPEDLSVLGSSVVLPGSRVRRDEVERMLAGLIQSQMLFLMIFSLRQPREVPVDWDAIYAGRQVQVADYLRPEEIALFRSSLRSQDVFELSTIRLL